MFLCICTEYDMEVGEENPEVYVVLDAFKASHPW